MHTCCVVCNAMSFLVVPKWIGTRYRWTRWILYVCFNSNWITFSLPGGDTVKGHLLYFCLFLFTRRLTSCSSTFLLYTADSVCIVYGAYMVYLHLDYVCSSTYYSNCMLSLKVYLVYILSCVVLLTCFPQLHHATTFVGLAAELVLILHISA